MAVNFIRRTLRFSSSSRTHLSRSLISSFSSTFTSETTNFFGLDSSKVNKPISSKLIFVCENHTSAAEVRTNEYNDYGVSQEQNGYGFHRSHSGVNGEGTRNEFPSNSFNNGTYGYSNGQMQQSPSANNQYQVSAYSEVNVEAESCKAGNGMIEPENTVSVEELDEFCKQGNAKEAVRVLGLLEEARVPMDLHRFLQLMHVCGEAQALQEAKVVHEHIMRSVNPLNVSTYNRILEMYSKCGSMDDAFSVFNKMPERNLTTWDTMITGLAKNDMGEEAIDLFTRFKKEGFRPDDQMFIGVFSACTVVGDIDEGLLHFESMIKDYGIVPSMAHYTSVVNMFGSIGHLDEALEFIEKMPKEPTLGVWETIMNLSRIHGNTELGDRCAEIIEKLDSSYLNGQSKEGLVAVRASDQAKEGQKKLSKQNSLEIRSRVHEYRAGDTSHPENDRIYAMLKGLKEQMKEAGYVPETRFVLHDIDQESKEDALLAHSERLASAYGFLTSAARSPIRVIKNLRVCGDCHKALKIISKIVGRELIMRDAKRFHHFKDGVCSCRDYW